MFLKRLFLFVCMMVLCAGAAHAQSSLGIGSAEQPVGQSNGFFNWLGAEQRAFYRKMTDTLQQMRQDGSAFWLLVGISFLYGIIHAAGPGHGKVVISSYMLANETALRRGVVLSFASSALQAISAITIVGVGFLVLRGTSVSMTDATVWLERASYVLIILFGKYLLLRKLKQAGSRSALAVGGALNNFYHPEPAHLHHHHADDSHSHEHTHDHDHAHGHNHSSDEVCSTCGHAHMPMPDQLTEDMDWRSGLAAVVAVGIRPCSGAVVVLSFALLNGLYAGGIASVFAMSLGTAITVSTLATIAVTAKSVALKYSGSAAMSGRAQLIIELVGAGLLILLGGLMLAGSLSI